jgi:hypothetical protein
MGSFGKNAFEPTILLAFKSGCSQFIKEHLTGG